MVRVLIIALEVRRNWTTGGETSELTGLRHEMGPITMEFGRPSNRVAAINPREFNPKSFIRGGHQFEPSRARGKLVLFLERRLNPSSETRHSSFLVLAQF